MPDNDVIFDYHEHHDTGHHYAVTHQHDVHPLHHHDVNGSVVYIHHVDFKRGPDVNGPTWYDGCPVRPVIGAGGNDIDSRTTPPAAGSDAP